MGRARMYLVAAILVWVLVLAIPTDNVRAQSPGSSFGFSTGGTCQAPTKGMVLFCGDAVKGMTQSIDGAPYASIVGATGPAGPAGAQGPPGSAGTLPASFNCANVSITAAGISLSGCK